MAAVALKARFVGVLLGEPAILEISFSPRRDGDPSLWPTLVATASSAAASRRAPREAVLGGGEPLELDVRTHSARWPHFSFTFATRFDFDAFARLAADAERSFGCRAAQDVLRTDVRVPVGWLGAHAPSAAEDCVGAGAGGGAGAGAGSGAGVGASAGADEGADGDSDIYDVGVADFVEGTGGEGRPSMRERSQSGRRAFLSPKELLARQAADAAEVSGTGGVKRPREEPSAGGPQPLRDAPPRSTSSAAMQLSPSAAPPLQVPAPSRAQTVPRQPTGLPMPLTDCLELLPVSGDEPGAAADSTKPTFLAGPAGDDDVGPDDASNAPRRNRFYVGLPFSMKYTNRGMGPFLRQLRVVELAHDLMACTLVAARAAAVLAKSLSLTAPVALAAFKRKCVFCDAIECRAPSRRKVVGLHPLVPCDMSARPNFVCEPCHVIILERRRHALQIGFLLSDSGSEVLCALCGQGAIDGERTSVLSRCCAQRCPRAYCKDCLEILLNANQRQHMAASALTWFCPPCAVLAESEAPPAPSQAVAPAASPPPISSSSSSSAVLASPAGSSSPTLPTVSADSARMLVSTYILDVRMRTVNAASRSRKLDTEAVCFCCKDGGELVECDHIVKLSLAGSRGGTTLVTDAGALTFEGRCSKVYHKHPCLGFEPDDNEGAAWKCPRHFCCACAEAAVAACRYCPSSFCGQHLAVPSQAAGLPSEAIACFPLCWLGGGSAALLPPQRTLENDAPLALVICAKCRQTLAALRGGHLIGSDALDDDALFR